MSFNDTNEIINIPNYTLQASSTHNVNNVNESEDDDSAKLNRNSYYDINNNDINNKRNDSQIQTELSTMSSSSNLNEEESLDKEIDSDQSEKLNRPIIKEEHTHFSSSLLYGNSFNDYSPKHIGNMFAFFYINKKPLILIGPDCKNDLYNFLSR